MDQRGLNALTGLQLTDVIIATATSCRIGAATCPVTEAAGFSSLISTSMPTPFYALRWTQFLTSQQ